MAIEPKTKPVAQTIEDYLAAIADTQRRQDCEHLTTIMKKATGAAPVVWANNVVGFGQYHYKSSRSRCEGDWFVTGFASRKTGLVVYIIPGFSEYADLLSRLGNPKVSKSCLYLKSLESIDIDALSTLIKRSVEYMVENYTTTIKSKK